MSPSTQKFIQIDQEGFFHFEEVRVTDEKTGLSLSKNLYLNKNGSLKTKFDDKDAFVEAYDAPLIVKSIEKDQTIAPAKGQASSSQEVPSRTIWKLNFNYGYSTHFEITQENFSLDEWDRFNGTFDNGLSFVFSRKAQASFFDLLEDFDDDSITVDGERIELEDWLNPENSFVENHFWDERFESENKPWEKHSILEFLKEILPQIKILKSRILIPGCGMGEEAHWLAEQGHIVSAVDFSSKAIERARNKYPENSNLKWICADYFDFVENNKSAFDLVIENHFYCAIPPTMRTKLVNSWHQVLVETGHVLGKFIGFPRRSGPPFGGSEWEIHRRLTQKNLFHPLYWMRWRKSAATRLGKELVLFAQKIEK